MHFNAVEAGFPESLRATSVVLHHPPDVVEAHLPGRQAAACRLRKGRRPHVRRV